MEDMEAGFEVHACMGDATNEDACQKSKVQVGFVFSSFMHGGLQAAAHLSCCDLRVIRASTAAELEQIIVKQL
eukprot:5774998-Pyramimonas_sp.AAC.1